MENEIKSFEDLIVWKESMQLCIDLHNALYHCKHFRLRDQAQRSSISIPSNISEGFEQNGDKVYLRYLYIAKGSSGELRTQLKLLQSLDILNESISNDFIQRVKRISGMLQNMIASKKNSMNV